MARREEADEVAARELLLYLDNERDIYDQKKLIAANLLRKIKKKVYSHTRAVDAWAYIVERAAKKYAKEFSSSERDWSMIFVPATRDLVTRELADRWYENARAGRPEEV